MDGLQSPAGYWQSLESEAFRHIDPDLWLGPPIRESNVFVRWFITRQPLRTRQLRRFQWLFGTDLSKSSNKLAWVRAQTLH